MLNTLQSNLEFELGPNLNLKKKIANKNFFKYVKI